MSPAETSALSCRISGAILVLGAAAKLVHPYEAAAAIGRIAPGTAPALLAALCAVEVTIGLLLVLRPYSVQAGAGVAVFGALLVGHSLLPEDCGCFGRIPVPPWLVVGSTVGGLICCALRLRCAERPTRGSMVCSLSLVAGMVVGGVTLVRAPPEQGATSRLAELLEDSGPSIVVVASSTCPECKRLFASITPEQIGAGWQILGLFRQSDRSIDAAMTPYPWIRPRRVPDETWWELLFEAPPTLYVIDGAGGVRRKSQGTLSELLRAVR